MATLPSESEAVEPPWPTLRADLMITAARLSPSAYESVCARRLGWSPFQRSGVYFLQSSASALATLPEQADRSAVIPEMDRWAFPGLGLLQRPLRRSDSGGEILGLGIRASQPTVRTLPALLGWAGWRETLLSGDQLRGRGVECSRRRITATRCEPEECERREVGVPYSTSI